MAAAVKEAREALGGARAALAARDAEKVAETRKPWEAVEKDGA